MNEQQSIGKRALGLLADIGRKLGRIILWQPFGGPIRASKTAHVKHIIFSIVYRLAFAPLVLAVAWLVLLGALMHPQRAHPAIFPERFDMVWQDVEFTSGDGVKLSGWYLCAMKPTDVIEGEKWKESRPAVVLCHQYGASRDQLLSPLATQLLEAGYDVLAFDFRGHGYSGDAPVSFGHTEAADVLAAVEALRNISGVDGERIGVYGTGMGGYAALLAGPRSKDVRCVVAESAYPSVNAHLSRKATRSRLPAMFGAAEAWGLNLYFGQRLVDDTASDAVHAYGDRGLLLINGARDTLTPPQAMQDIIEAGRGEVMTLVVAGADDHDALSDPNTTRVVVKFFDRYLKK